MPVIKNLFKGKKKEEVSKPLPAPVEQVSKLSQELVIIKGEPPKKAKPIFEYLVVREMNRTDLEREVAKLLNEGFKLAGGIALAFDAHQVSPSGVREGQRIYCQALIKEKEEGG